MKAESPHERRICGAKTRSGEPCQKPPLANGRCRLHGGRSLAGIASPTIKTGRYSKYLPGGLAEKYHEALEDTELESLNSELALVNARIADVLTHVEVGEVGVAWMQMRALYHKLDNAIKTQKVTGMLEVMADMDALTSQGVGEFERWKEIYELMELRRRLAETERRRLIDMQQYITSQQAMVMIGTLLGIIKARVDDRNVLAAIQHDVNALLASPR